MTPDERARNDIPPAKCKVNRETAKKGDPEANLPTIEELAEEAEKVRTEAIGASTDKESFGADKAEKE